MSTQFKILLVALAICVISVFTIYSTTFDRENAAEKEIYKRQIIWIFIGVIFYLLFSNLPYRKFWDWIYAIYIVVILLLVFVLVLGAVRMGAQRWLKLVWLNFQPSELAKLTVIIMLARYFSQRSMYSIWNSPNYFGIIRGLILPFFIAALPMLLIIKQPDLGTSLLIFFVFLCMIYLARVNMKYLIIFMVFLLVCLPGFWHILKDYQRDRLLVFLNPDIDPLGAGYTVIQSKIAVGSGGLFGRGWLGGTQSQLHFLPEAHTDFIFSGFAEEWGFLGVCVLLSLYLFLLKLCLDSAEKEHDRFGRLLAFGITSMLAIQIFINIAMTVGLAPVVGIPLPLLSYGGSSILMVFISLGIIANIDKNRSIF
ncbi:MAG: rod shape-determining protein RodA [Candidatus Omnitrophica bacterium]|nr:rod shape-determining protein RodA [Candidatus Omnitrophota bacterium]